MEQIAIRYAESQDYSQVEMIMQQVQEMHVNWRPDIYKRGDVVLPPEIFNEAVQNKEFIVAETADQIVGLLFYMIRHIESTNQVTRNVLFIDSMAVAEGYRGQGVGHRLFEFAKQIRQHRNLDGIELQVNAKNSEAKAMYDKYGFTEKSINMELL